jgi:hypothetical protein
MRPLDTGHLYEIANLAPDGGPAGTQQIRFVKRLLVEGRTEQYPGTICQELLRVIIDRVQTLDKECPWPGNVAIVTKAREMLLLFEIRALERKLSKGEIVPERLAVSAVDGHFVLTEAAAEPPTG